MITTLFVAFVMRGQALALPVPKITVLPFSIEVERLPGVPERTDRAEIVQRLQNQTADWAVRALCVNGISREAGLAGSNPHSGSYVLTGTLRLPISLSARMYGLWAANRRGRFMSGELRLEDGSGHLVRREEFSLVWGDGHWLKGGPHRQKNATTDEVLLGFARKAVDRGVLALKEHSNRSTR